MSALFGVDTSPAAVESAAHAAYLAVCASGPTVLPPTPWEQVDETMRRHFRLIARAALDSQDSGSAS